MYTSIIDALVTASEEITDKTCKNFDQVLGWNDYCKAAHSDARNAYLIWRNSGKPRNGYMYSEMKRTRSYFKYVLRKCKSNKDINAANVLANKLLAKDDKGFWKEIKKMNTTNVPLANCVDGVTGSKNISSQWKAHFSNILNSSHDISSKESVVGELNDAEKLAFNRFTPSEVKEAIKDIKTGKCSGMDALYGEHFKYSHEKINVLLALVFNCMFVHGFVPESFMNPLIVPLVKDKR